MSLDIEKGALVLVIPWLLHRAEDLWDQPRHFMPERFLDEPSTFGPSGFGPSISGSTDPRDAAAAEAALAAVRQRRHRR